MQRPIKFRAWDITKKQMYLLGFTITCEGKISQTFGLFPSRQIQLMQYTGLKDKNGKEIYEGDIIKYEHLLDAEVVEATDGGWNPFISNMQTDGAWRYEVTGNIYENKDML